MSSPLTILNLTYADPANYPPTINACRTQAAAGHISYLAGYYRGTHRGFQAGEGIKEHYFNEPPGDYPNSPYSKMLAPWIFRYRTMNLIRRCEPDIIIAYDFLGLWGALPAIGRVPVIYHVHDMVTPGWERALSGIGRWMYRATLSHINGVTAVVMPEEKRLEVAKKTWGLEVPCFTVPNCARLTKPGRTNILQDLIEERHGVRPEHIVVRAGGYGAIHLIRESVLALQWLPETTHLCLIGCGDEKSAREVEQLSYCHGLRNRVHQIPYLNYDDMRAYLRSADIGLALYSRDDPDINRKYQGTASDKYMEYLSVGLPIVAMDCPSFRSLSERTGGVALAEDERPESIADAVRNALSNWAEAHHQLLASHATEFNHDKCYAPLLAFMEGLTRN